MCIMLNTVVRQCNIMLKVVAFLHTGYSPHPAVRSAPGCGQEVCSQSRLGIAWCCQLLLQQGLIGCASSPCAFLSVCEGRCTWNGRKMVRRAVDVQPSLLNGRGLIIMENTSGTNRSGELFSFPSGSHFPASPWTGAKMMFLIFCFQALQL